MAVKTISFEYLARSEQYSMFAQQSCEFARSTELDTAFHEALQAITFLRMAVRDQQKQIDELRAKMKEATP